MGGKPMNPRRKRTKRVDTKSEVRPKVYIQDDHMHVRLWRHAMHAIQNSGKWL